MLVRVGGTYFLVEDNQVNIGLIWDRPSTMTPWLRSSEYLTWMRPRTKNRKVDIRVALEFCMAFDLAARHLILLDASRDMIKDGILTIGEIKMELRNDMVRFLDFWGALNIRRKQLDLTTKEPAQWVRKARATEFIDHLESVYKGKALDCQVGRTGGTKGNYLLGMYAAADMNPDCKHEIFNAFLETPLEPVELPEDLHPAINKAIRKYYKPDEGQLFFAQINKLLEDDSQDEFLSQSILNGSIKNIKQVQRFIRGRSVSE